MKKQRHTTYPTNHPNTVRIPSLGCYLRLYSLEYANELNNPYGFIYKITNIQNEKIYIGKTTQSYIKRWNQHITTSRDIKKKSYLSNAIRKYGPENFEIEIIKTCQSKYQLDFSESFFIKKYKSYLPSIGYNMVIHDKDHKIKDDPKINIFKNPKTNPMKGKSLYQLWVNKYGKIIADQKLEEFKQKQRKIGQQKYSQGMLRKLTYKGISMSEENKKRFSEERRGSGNPMYNKSVYDIWEEKYGKEKSELMRKEDIRKKQETKAKNRLMKYK